MDSIAFRSVAPNLQAGLREVASVLPTDLRTAEDVEEYRLVGASRTTTAANIAGDLGLQRHELRVAGCPVTIFRDPQEPVQAHVVFLHGGGLIAGNRFDGADVVARHISNIHHDVWTLDYPLAPEHRLDEMIDSVLAVIESCGDDGLPIVLAGQSGGGGLAAACALAARDRGIRLAGHLLICPMLDNRERCSTRQFAESPAWSARSNQTAWSMALEGSEVLPPGEREDLNDLPPTFIDAGSAELFRDAVLDFAARLSGAGNSVELHVWSGAFHSSDCVVKEAEVSKQAHSARASWLQRLLAYEV